MPVILDDFAIKKLKARRRLKKFKPMRSPVKVERDLMKRLQNLWKDVLYPATDRITAMVKAGARPAEIADLIEQVLAEAEIVYGINTREIVWRWRLSLDTETRGAFNRSLNQTLGVDTSALLDTPAVADALALAGADASRLIKTIPEQYLAKVAQAVSDNFHGKPFTDGRSLVQQIRHIHDVSYKRAKVIARDQTAKMTSTLNQTRQESLGVSMYVWRTSRDERVVGRPSGLYPEGNSKHHNHFVMEDKTCRWDDPTVYSTDGGKTWKNRTGEMPKVHPGVEILCRCFAEPVLDIDQILANATRY